MCVCVCVRRGLILSTAGGVASSVSKTVPAFNIAHTETTVVEGWQWRPRLSVCVCGACVPSPPQRGASVSFGRASQRNTNRQTELCSSFLLLLLLSPFLPSSPFSFPPFVSTLLSFRYLPFPSVAPHPHPGPHPHSPLLARSIHSSLVHPSVLCLGPSSTPWQAAWRLPFSRRSYPE